MPAPGDPIAAVTHPDPYPYYAELVARRPLYHDDALGLWVASSAAAVTAVLGSELGRVRPIAEPVPKALLGSPAGDIFGRLVRMTDGAAHARAKSGVAVRLAALEPARVAAQAAAAAERLIAELAVGSSRERVAAFAFRLPVDVVASLLGVATAHLAQTAAWVGDFVACLAPGSSPEQLARGATAAGHLAEQFGSLLARPQLDAVVANTVGYLSQAYEATAGLVGNTLVALGREPEAARRLDGDPGLLRAVVREVVRFDPPVQNTRRFIAADGVVAGQPMKADDAVLVVLAAANRDPAANPEPARFDPMRRERRAFTFGLGAHACPGEELATSIAEAGVRRLLAAGADPRELAAFPGYRASANTRIPLFHAAAAGRR
jgi:cytochrome P450